MNRNDLRDYFRKFIRCRDITQDYDSPVNREIRMWRNRYLDEISDINEWERLDFLSLTSEQLISPEPKHPILMRSLYESNPH